MHWKETDEKLIRRGELILDLESLKNHEKELKNMNEGRPGPRYKLAASYIQLVNLWGGGGVWWGDSIRYMIVHEAEIRGYRGHLHLIDEKDPNTMVLVTMCDEEDDVLNLKKELFNKVSKELEEYFQITPDITIYKVRSAEMLKWINFKDRESFLLALPGELLKFAYLMLNIYTIINERVVKPLISGIPASRHYWRPNPRELLW